MNYLTTSLLDNNETKTMKRDLNISNKNWEDGKKTAGSHAAAVKNNLQLNRESDISQKYSALIKKKDAFKSFN